MLLLLTMMLNWQRHTKLYQHHVAQFSDNKIGLFKAYCTKKRVRISHQKSEQRFKNCFNTLMEAHKIILLPSSPLLRELIQT